MRLPCATHLVAFFECEDDARRYLSQLHGRLETFALALHPDKTRLLEFGRYADTRRRARGNSKPETFDFLGFTHVCGKTRAGNYTVFRYTVRKRFTAKVKAIGEQLQVRMHDPVPKTGAWLRSVVQGHFNYYGVPMNSRRLGQFRCQVSRHWWRALRRRSQRSKVTSERMKRLTDKWLPPARIVHPYPTLRFDEGKRLPLRRSRMR